MGLRLLTTVHAGTRLRWVCAGMGCRAHLSFSAALFAYGGIERIKAVGVMLRPVEPLSRFSLRIVRARPPLHCRPKRPEVSADFLALVPSLDIFDQALRTFSHLGALPLATRLLSGLVLAYDFSDVTFFCAPPLFLQQL